MELNRKNAKTMLINSEVWFMSIQGGGGLIWDCEIPEYIEGRWKSINTELKQQGKNKDGTRSLFSREDGTSLLTGKKYVILTCGDTTITNNYLKVLYYRILSCWCNYRITGITDSRRMHILEGVGHEHIRKQFEAIEIPFMEALATPYPAHWEPLPPRISSEGSNRSNQ